MEPIWQTVIVAVAFVVALAYLVWYQIRKRRKASACQSCPALRAMAESTGRRKPDVGSDDRCPEHDDGEQNSQSRSENSR